MIKRQEPNTTEGNVRHRGPDNGGMETTQGNLGQDHGQELVMVFNIFGKYRGYISLGTRVHSVIDYYSFKSKHR